MEAQKCKLCGARHHRYEPHVFREAENEPELDRVQLPRSCDSGARQANELPPKNASGYVAGDGDDAGHADMERPILDVSKIVAHAEALKTEFTTAELRQAYNAFMRTYMRKRRAGKP